ncbi:MAG: aromatic ring-hydroxylating dioxygenase subunit alpha [Bacteroidia bacterium]
MTVGMARIDIDPDIQLARTPPGTFYTDPEAYEAMRTRVFSKSWQWIGVHSAVREPESTFPFTLLEGMLDEPLLLTKADDGLIRLVSNVCTHRGNLLQRKAGPCKALRCRYHGRRFDLTGQLTYAPGFETAEDFPSESDHLPSIPMAEWGPFLFASLGPAHSFGIWIADLKRYLHWLPLGQFRLDSTRTKDFTFDAHWALYVENYLEGFHIPFVHKGLNAAIDIQRYETELLEWGVLQKAIAKEGQISFDLPPESPDFGKQIAAYYFWLFPNLMLNFYPWGLSVNVVKPQGIRKTKVSFVTYVHQPQMLGRGAGADLEVVEMEDEEVVLDVQRGIGAKMYQRGRYSPTQEQGVHHFHRLLMEQIS